MAEVGTKTTKPLFVVSEHPAATPAALGLAAYSHRPASTGTPDFVNAIGRSPIQVSLASNSAGPEPSPEHTPFSR